MNQYPDRHNIAAVSVNESINPSSLAPAFNQMKIQHYPSNNANQPAHEQNHVKPKIFRELRPLKEAGAS